MSYILFEKKAIEKMINEVELQSMDFDMSNNFIRYIKGETADFSLKGINIIKEKDGLLFCGKDTSKTFLLIDLNQCELFEKANDLEILIVLQKVFRFAVRFWNHQPPTSSERMFKDKTVIFPFPHSKKPLYRIVIQRNAKDRRLQTRGIQSCLLAYKYGDEGTSSENEENPDLSALRKGGTALLDRLPEIKRQFIVSKNTEDKSEMTAIHMVEASKVISNSEFKFLQYEKQVEKLTRSQKEIVYCKDLCAPIRVEGPAGTGKTAALVLRAIRLLKEAEEQNEDLTIAFFVHSKSTEVAVQQMLSYLADDKWFNKENRQYIFVTTLQDYCIEFIKIKETQIIDIDASEAKQYQLYIISEIYNKIKGNIFNTYAPLMSENAISFFNNEDESKIIKMLQYEFSTRIKGMAEADIEKYKKLKSLKNGLPIENEGDKEFIFRIFTDYQQYLEDSAVYDTDDIILEATARLSAPLWRRARANDGVDYLFVDEMHLFNLNEQHVFHFLTKDGGQENIPICFALDYAQVIGERNDIKENYIENTLAKGEVLKQEFSTIFRSSQQIAELCASITASGALLFASFINPYKYCESCFTAKEEERCEIPKLIMFENDSALKSALPEHIKKCINEYKCQLSEIALVFFDEEMLEKYYTEKVGEYNVNYINGRNTIDNKEHERNRVVCSIPEYINGLEFKCVILVGVDAGRVPQVSVSDISANFLKYNALNKLYLACSRAQYSVTIMGTKVRGYSECLQHSIANKTIEVCEL